MISQLFSQLYYVPLYFESVQGKSPTEAGIGLFPATFTFIPVGIIVGRLITRTGRYREFVWSGWAITTLVCGLLILFDTNTNTATWASILILLGIGHGLVLTSLTFATQAIAEDGDAAFAATMYAFTRSVDWRNRFCQQNATEAANEWSPDRNREECGKLFGNSQSFATVLCPQTRREGSLCGRLSQRVRGDDWNLGGSFVVESADQAILP
jgi:MFS family permease